MSDATPLPAGFDGTARLFPLPNLVLFPHVVQPLHIFEPRYRQMTADALASDRLIAPVLLRPGWEDDYQSRPAIHPVACVGKVIADQRLEDGRYNLLLRGLRRARVIEEVPTAKLYRTARVELIEDVCALPSGMQKELRDELGRLVPHWFPGQEQLLEQFDRLLGSDLALGALADVFAFALPLEVEFKQQLLEEADVRQRVMRLLARLEGPAPAAAGGDRHFPPQFSEN